MRNFRNRTFSENNFKKSKLLDKGDESDVGTYLSLTDEVSQSIEDHEENVLQVLDKTKNAPATVSKLNFCPRIA